MVKIYFRIPLTWYWIGKVTPFHPKDIHPAYFCLFTKCWDNKLKDYYFKALI